MKWIDADQSRKGYWLNQFCMSVMKADNRARFKANERAYLDEWSMTEAQKQAVIDRAGGQIADQLLDLEAGDAVLMLAYGEPYREAEATIAEARRLQLPIVLITDPGHESDSAMRLGRIGFDQVAGYLQGGLGTLKGRPDLTATMERLSARVAAKSMRDT